MKKEELIQNLLSDPNLNIKTKEEASVFVDSFINQMKYGIKKDGVLEISGFGKFAVKNLGERKTVGFEKEKNILFKKGEDVMENKKTIFAKDKLYAFYTDDGVSHLIETVSVVDVEGIKMVKGINKKIGSWVEGKMIYLSLSKISGIYEFENIEDYEKCSKKFHKDKSEPSSNNQKEK